MTGVQRWQVIAAAEEFGGVLSRGRFRKMNVDRNVVAREVAAGRWCLYGRQTVAVHTTQLDGLAVHWRAVWEAGERVAALDGVSALQAAGMTGSTPPWCTSRFLGTFRRGAVSGVRLHRVTRVADEVRRAGVPRVSPGLATIRAASWAVSDRQAALLLVLPVQQRIVHSSQPRQGALGNPGSRPGGARDSARGRYRGRGAVTGRARLRSPVPRVGVPEPDRQHVVRTAAGRVCLDVRWSSIGLVVEIDGSGHERGTTATDDGLRQNRVTIKGDMVLRFDLVALRVRADEVEEQVCAAHATLGRLAAA